MEIQVFKFGGASVKDAAGVKNVCSIIQNSDVDKLVVVVSAMGKTTNKLEEILADTRSGRKDAALLKINDLFHYHHLQLEDLAISRDEYRNPLNEIKSRAESVVNQYTGDEHSYYYDELISCGEDISALILSQFLNKSCDKRTMHIDARELIITDPVHTEAKVNWDLTLPVINEKCRAAFSEYDIVVVQGFIGRNEAGETTTLGREGSDYTASILSFAMDAVSMTVWKDVDGILNGDPNVFDNVMLMSRLSYREAIEMTYYGAKVIHPKTIKPLQNKGIPLYVKSFLNPQSEGTKIGNHAHIKYPPIVVIESNQALLSIAVRDFSFVAEYHLSAIFSKLAALRIKVNMMRNTAISFTACVGDNPGKLKKLSDLLSDEFDVDIQNQLDLITIRHYTDSVLSEMKKDKLVLLEEEMGTTVQLVVKDIPMLTKKHHHDQ
jgi:aspartate kinase